jgi:MOSC domain-containing protein YiiM
LKGRVVAVCRSIERGKRKEDFGLGFFEKGLGLQGDAHAGTEKEVSILIKEKVDELSNQTGLFFPPGAFAENLLIAGLNQSGLLPGIRLKVGSAALLIERIGKEKDVTHSYNFLGYSLLPDYGVFAKVIESGAVKNGDEVEILLPFSKEGA